MLSQYVQTLMLLGCLQDESDYKVVEKTLEKVKTGFDGQVSSSFLLLLLLLLPGQTTSLS
jgi:hypothetical protein